MNKRLIRLTESDLHKIVKESVNRVLNEIGDTSKGQRALGGLHARKVLRNNDLSRKTYDYAEKARGGDKYDNRGNNDNPLYHDYANGYIDYLNSHPSEYMDNKRKRMAESKEDYDYIMSVRNNPIFQQELKKAWDKEIKTNPNPDFDSFEYRFATNYLNKQMEQERWGISMFDGDEDAYNRHLNPSRYWPDGY